MIKLSKRQYNITNGWSLILSKKENIIKTYGAIRIGFVNPNSNNYVKYTKCHKGCRYVNKL
jgi:hypothetical protein